VGGGNKSGVNLVALLILPLIFILPCMKAICGLSLAKHTYSKSSSVIVKVASAEAGFVFLVVPYPFFKSISYVPKTLPPFVLVISKPKMALTLGIKSLPRP